MGHWRTAGMTKVEQIGTVRKRAIILRESQNRPLSSVGPQRPPNEFADLEKRRMKRECHRPNEAALSQDIPLLRKSVTRIEAKNGFICAMESERRQTIDSNGRRAASNGRAIDAALTPEPTSSSCDDAFHFTRQITPSVFMKQKLRLELLERAMAVCQGEKRQLQKQLQASLQTAFKLQEVIMKQRMVIELEQIATQEQSGQTEQIRTERDELKRKLDEAIRAKEEAELTLTLSRDLNVRLFPGTGFADDCEGGDVHTSFSPRIEAKDDVRQLSDDEQMEVLRQKLDESNVNAVVHQTVAECVYFGCLRESEAGKVQAVQSMEIRTEELRRKLDEAVRLKEEAQLTLSLSRDLNTRLFPGTGKRCKTEERFVALEEDSVLSHELLGEKRIQASDEQGIALGQELDQIRVEAAVYQAVLECVYIGALQASEAKRVEGRQLSDSLAKKVEDLKDQIFTLHEKINSCEETVELPNFRPISVVEYEQQDPLVSGEGTTPLKLRSDETPIKFFRSKRVTSKAPPIDTQSGSPWIPRSTTLDFCIAAKREAALNADLRKSVQEMEILGNRVEQHKSILEKVTLLLSYISKSGYSANGSKHLARDICDELERYDAEFR